MKTIVGTLIICLASFIITPTAEAFSPVAKAPSTLLDGGWRGVNKKSAKRFKTHRGMRRSKMTCLNKNGCKRHKAARAKTACPIR